jgi:hypothetical protein
MPKSKKVSKKAIPGAKHSTSVRFDKIIFKRSKAKKAVNGATKSSCPILAQKAKVLKIPKKKPTTTGLKGVFGEHVSDALMVKLGHTKLNGQPTQIGDSPIGNGLDGVWKGANPPPAFIITETKFGSSDLGDTKDGVQMSNNWIRNRLQKACGKKKADAVKKEMDKVNPSVEKWIIHVDDAGVKNVEKLKLK